MPSTRILPGLLLALCLPVIPGWAGPALGQPKLPPPTLQRVLAGSIVGNARVRWSKSVAGARVAVSVGVGAAERLNPAWSPEPVRLRYDLNQNRDVERELKRAVPSLRPQGEASRREAGHLGTGGGAQGATGPDDRTLEILGRGQEGWVVVGTWTWPASRWRKQQGALFRLLEPLFDAPAETFVPVKSERRPAQ